MREFRTTITVPEQARRGGSYGPPHPPPALQKSHYPSKASASPASRCRRIGHAPTPDSSSPATTLHTPQPTRPEKPPTSASSHFPNPSSPHARSPEPPAPKPTTPVSPHSDAPHAPHRRSPQTSAHRHIRCRLPSARSGADDEKPRANP